MHNRVEADVFIPAGGRPNTIDASNWRQFLKSDGTPSSPLVVEGANLFITPEARQSMFEEAGILIVKDSSANKAGVICSSYEICAAMLLTEDEFLDNKEEIVGDVLVKLRHFAKVEAELLFREFENYPGALPHFSGLISDTINRATDAVNQELQKLDDDEIER
jgi:glutamate dehydrogenase